MEFLNFNLDGTEPFAFEPKYLLNAGYVGRDQESVRMHIEELKAMGSPAPDKTPCFFPKAPGSIQQDGDFCALDEDCGGEVEYVLLVAEDGWYITVGADVFDIKAEAIGVAKSKSLYPNYLAKDAWRYEDVKDHWDELVLRSWIGPDRTLYQETKLGHFLHIEDMVKEMLPYLKKGLVPGTVLSGGSGGYVIDGFPYIKIFEFEIEDPVLDRKITGKYENQLIDWIQK